MSTQGPSELSVGSRNIRTLSIPIPAKKLQQASQLSKQLNQPIATISATKHPKPTFSFLNKRNSPRIQQVKKNIQLQQSFKANQLPGIEKTSLLINKTSEKESPRISSQTKLTQESTKTTATDQMSSKYKSFAEDEENPFMTPQTSQKRKEIVSQSTQNQSFNNLTEAERVALYKSKFKSFIFYLDGVDVSKHVKLLKALKELGAVGFILFFLKKKK